MLYLSVSRVMMHIGSQDHNVVRSVLLHNCFFKLDYPHVIWHYKKINKKYGTTTTVGFDYI